MAGQRKRGLLDRLMADPAGWSLWVIGLLVIVALLGFYSCAKAATLTGSYTLPTKYEDGTTLPQSSIAYIGVEVGTCTGTAPAYTFGTKEGEVQVPPPATTYSVTVPRSFGLFCARARTVTTLGTPSVYTAAVSVNKVEPAPNPPVLAVPVIAGMLQTPVYTVTSTGARGTFVGFVDVGKQCSGPALFTYRGKSFREVPRTAVKLWGSTSLRLAAPCA